MRFSILFAIALAVVAQRVHAQGDDRVAWLRSHAVRFDDASRDADLAAIGRALDGVDVVFLGESTHGDGGGHLARVRLVRYLHERLGFDLIAWEAGVRESAVFDSLLATPAPLGSITPTALYPWWAQSAELRPVLQYLRDTRATSRPLGVAGFDIQRSGPIEELVRYVTAGFARAGGTAALPRALTDSLDHAIARMRSMTGPARDSAEERLERGLHSAAADLRMRLQSHREALTRAVGERETSQLERVLENLASHAEQLRLARETDPGKRQAAAIAAYNLREQRNAENILWLRARNPGRKIIVWSHNVHAVGTGFTARFDGVVAQPGAGARDATARLVKRGLGQRAYAVAMLAYEGVWAFPGGDANTLPAAQPGSLAALLHEAAAPRAFLDLRPRTTAGATWLQASIVGTLNAQSPARYPIEWPRAVDGILFIDRMTPSTMVPE